MYFYSIDLNNDSLYCLVDPALFNLTTKSIITLIQGSPRPQLAHVLLVPPQVRRSFIALTAQFANKWPLTSV